MLKIGYFVIVGKLVYESWDFLSTICDYNTNWPKGACYLILLK
jgi:hypothetical protein